MGIAAAAAIGAVGAIGGSVIASKGANSAADKASAATAQAADQSTQVQREQMQLAKDIYGENKAALAPWQQYGMDATGNINSLLELLPGGAGVNMGFDAYKNSTGYNERLKAGGELINGNYAGNGVFNSGARGKALTKYGQDYASGEFGNYINSLLPRLNAYEGMRNLGFNAASAQAGVGNNYASQTGAAANNLSNIFTSQGDNLANVALIKGQNSANTANTIGNSLGQFAGSFLSPQQSVYQRASPYANAMIAQNSSIF